jgi:hypothetical protein
MPVNASAALPPGTGPPQQQRTAAEIFRVGWGMCAAGKMEICRTLHLCLFRERQPPGMCTAREATTGPGFEVKTHKTMARRPGWVPDAWRPSNLQSAILAQMPRELLRWGHVRGQEPGGIAAS